MKKMPETKSILNDTHKLTLLSYLNVIEKKYL